MRYKSFYPVIVTENLELARSFYGKTLGFEVVFQTDWYIHMHAPREGSGKPNEIAFVLPNLESQPDALKPAFSGQGVLLTLEVDEVDPLFAELRAAGCQVLIEPRDEAWGQRHCLVRDPLGNLLDVVKQTAPDKEYERAYV